MNRSAPRIQRVGPRHDFDATERTQAPRASFVAANKKQTVFLETPMPVIGQGVASFTLTTSAPFRIILTNERMDTSGDVIVLEVDEKGARFRNKDNDDPASILASIDAPEKGLDVGSQTAYWLSLDSQNRLLRYGKGYAQAQLTLLKWKYPDGSDPNEIDPAKLPYAWTQKLQFVALSYDPSATAPGTQDELSPMPVTRDLPAIIVSSQTITMEELARGEVTVAANLSPGANILYANVAGADIQLDTPDFPDFSDAINYSVMTPGCVCYNLLKAKEQEFGKPNPRGTYLRITLGDNLGDSPGIPYVLEIWPGQNYSPIHNHAGADAVIKVLHGQIQSRWFAELSPLYMNYYEAADLYAGQVTWLSPKYYQTHQLFNPMPEGHICATLQCYRFPDKDHEHNEYFDYLAEVEGEPGKYEIQRFYPNSDMKFLEFKAKVRAEWEQVLAKSREAGPSKRASKA